MLMETMAPSPPLPATVDLRSFEYMPLDVVRLRDSETVLKTKPESFRCAVLLWCASWHQVPAASLPDDEEVLADLAGFGRAVKEWKRVKEGALRGFVKCSDGRLYHTVVAAKAVTAWLSMLEQRWRTECARIKKQCQRNKLPFNPPAFGLWISKACPEAVPYLSQGTQHSVPEDNDTVSKGQPPHVPRETPSKGSEVKGYIPAVTSTSTGNSEARAKAHPDGGTSTSTPEASGPCSASGTAPTPELVEKHPLLGKMLKAQPAP